MSLSISKKYSCSWRIGLITIAVVANLFLGSSLLPLHNFQGKMSVLSHLSRRFASKPILKNVVASYGSLINRNSAPIIRNCIRHGPLKALSECFRNEIADEEESIPQLVFFKMVKKIKKSFTIIDEAGKESVTLKRKHKKESIEIIFDCHDKADPDDDEESEDYDEEEEEEEDDDEEEEEEEEEQEEADGINFKAIITKPGGEKIVIQCAAFESIKVNGVRYIAAGQNVKDATLYSGPVFDYLDYDLRVAFYSYLSDRKIDDDLAHFISRYAVEKNQNEYVIWLHKLANFTSE